jgi:hypothetical protein
MGEKTLRPPNFVIKNNIFIIYFLVTYEHYIYIYLINIKLKLVNCFKNPTSIKKLECMEYSFDKIIFVTKFQKLHINFKIRVVGKIFGRFFLC